MDPRFLKLYNRELQHIREVGAEFAAEFPKIAARLGLDNFECSDPYVERLFEGFAFMAARVQLKVDAEFPTFTQHLLDIIYPHYLAATPSMTIVEFKADLSDETLAEGFWLPRDTHLRSQIAKGEQTACEYLTVHPLQLLPLEITQLEYLPSLAAVSSHGINPAKQHDIKAAIRIKLRSTVAVNFNQINLNNLTLFLRGAGNTPYRLYEQFIANAKLTACKFDHRGTARIEYGAESNVRGLGFNTDESLLKQTPRSFDGYRVLQEYFAFPERFLFVELSNLSSLLANCEQTEVELFVLFNRSENDLINTIDKSNLALFCVPAVNLFPKKTDRMHIDHRQAEYHLVVDRTKPMDYEVTLINQVVGFNKNSLDEQTFLPFYGSKTGYHAHTDNAFYIARRQKRLLSSKQRREGVRSSYIGSEVFLSLVDAKQAPYSPDLAQLGIEALCTNRDLPLVMPVGVGESDFTLQISAPVNAIRCLVGPTRPIPAAYESESIWKSISHLSLNYLSLVDNDPQQGAAALREMLSLYADNREPAIKKQIEGVVSISSKNIVRRIDSKGPLVFGRGLEVSVVLDESAFEGGSFFLLGTVLESFFSQYVSINSFVETVVCTTDRGEVYRWPIRMGQRQNL